MRLKVTHADGRAEELAITRGVVQIRERPRLPARRRPRGLPARPRARISVTSAINSVHVRHGRELKAAIEDLKGRGVKGLILDLRGCPGGLLNAATDAARLFLAKGTIVTIRGRGEAGQVHRGRRAAGPGGRPLARSCWSTAPRPRPPRSSPAPSRTTSRAIVVGSRTFGKGSIQTIVKLKDDGGAIKLTTAYYRLPRGRDIDRREGKADWGVDPTDGYYVPVDGTALEAMTRRRRERGRIGGPAAAPAKVSPESIERDEFDPPLAAALKSMAAWTIRRPVRPHAGLPIGEQAARLSGDRAGPQATPGPPRRPQEGREGDRPARRKSGRSLSCRSERAIVILSTRESREGQTPHAAWSVPVMRRMGPFAGLAVLALVGRGPGPADIRFNTNFEGGSLGRIERSARMRSAAM